RVAGARLIVANGRGLDAWADGLVGSAGRDARAVRLAEGLPALDDNPHFWFDVRFARTYVERIRDALAGIDPAGAPEYARRAQAYLAELDALDRELRAEVAQIPAERRKLVTSHDAFPYFAAAYGFEVIGFVQPEPGKEPSPAELAELVGAVRAEAVPAIFSEAGVSPRLAETLAREAGVRRVVTDLPTDSLLEPPADSYVGLMRHLVEKIVEALR
ncbi:MAG: metal ABC transporter substrate-binding protein, partial [Candidatus Limnocylindria bacterium]